MVDRLDPERACARGQGRYGEMGTGHQGSRDQYPRMRAPNWIPRRPADDAARKGRRHDHPPQARPSVRSISACARRLSAACRGRAGACRASRLAASVSSSWWCRSRRAAASTAIARIVGARLSEIWGQQVVVENKPGAGGNIASEFVARSGARRLHHVHHRRRIGRQSLPLPFDQLRSGRRFRSGHADLPLSQSSGGAEFLALAFRRRSPRGSQGRTRARSRLPRRVTAARRI